MADKIKKFFQKKKVDAKFKLAGPGYKLTEDRPQSSSHSKSITSIPSRVEPSAEAKQAAAAALARLGGQRPDHATFNTSLAAIQAQVRRELEMEKKLKEGEPSNQESTLQRHIEEEKDIVRNFTVAGVYFKCPIIGNEILSKDEWNSKIRNFLYEQLEEEPGLTACLIIHTCNKNREKIKLCVDTLCKYLENIVQNPTEEKYRRIRMSNRAFQDRVLPVEGSQELLRAAGFEIKREHFQKGEEDFLVFSEDKLSDVESLLSLCDALQTAEAISLELDRNLQVLLPSQAAKPIELPPVFFSLSPEELKREQQLRKEAMEKSMMLRTKAMREKEEQREMKKYRYALIRVRFPDGILLQGTFSVHEKLEEVRNFVSENLDIEDQPFVLVAPSGHILCEEDHRKSLVDLRLAPAAVLIFSPEDSSQQMYLKPEVMLLAQSI